MGGGARGRPICSLDCKQQIELICHLDWKETAFFLLWGGERESHFSNPKEPINLSSLLGSPPPPGEWRGWGGALRVCVWGGGQTLWLLFFSACFAPILTPLPSHLLPSVRLLLPKCLRVCVSLPLFCNAARVCFSSGCLCNPEERRGVRSGGHRKENGFYCSELMLFCV